MMYQHHETSTLRLSVGLQDREALPLGGGRIEIGGGSGNVNDERVNNYSYIKLQTIFPVL